MPVSQSKIIANKKYRSKTYDTIGFDVPKGKREEFKAKAAEHGFSLAKFLFVAAEAYDGGEVTPAPVVEDKLPADQRRLVEEFNRLPSDARRQLVKFLQALNAGNHDAK